MARALWLADILTDAGLVVRPYPGWQTRGSTTLDPQGVMLHHTVTSPNTADAVIDKFLAVTGSLTTPAPLSNYSTNRDGSVSIIAAGTANHGGAGTWKGLTGNKWWLGDEMKNLGSSSLEPWAAKQLEAAYRAAAACLKHIGRDESWLMGHKEYATPPGRKTDPHTLNMNTVRATIKTILEDDMPLNADDLKAIKNLLDEKIGPVGTITDANGNARPFHQYTVNGVWHATAAGKRMMDHLVAAGSETPVDEAAIASAVVAAMTPGLQAAVAAELKKLTLKAQ